MIYIKFNVIFLYISNLYLGIFLDVLLSVLKCIGFYLLTVLYFVSKIWQCSGQISWAVSSKMLLFLSQIPRYWQIEALSKGGMLGVVIIILGGSSGSAVGHRTLRDISSPGTDLCNLPSNAAWCSKIQCNAVKDTVRNVLINSSQCTVFFLLGLPWKS